MGRLKKHQSKRQTLRTKYKIQKKVKEFKKKQKRALKNNPHPTWKTRRDPGIPNDWPFKAELLSEIEKQNAAQAAIDAAKRAERKARQQERKANPATFHEQTALPTSLSSTTVTTAPIDPFTVRSRQTLRLLRQLVQQSQLILFCLDARDPMGSRWQQLESKLAATPNAPPLLFVLTHCDTVPADVVDLWVAALSREYVAVAFVSDRDLDDKDRKPTVTTEKKLKHHTTDALIQLVHSYRPEAADDGGQKARGAEEAVNVAVMGFENTGKSSVVNALMRAHWCGVSSHAGYTKDVQVVRLGESVRLHDSPGVPSLPTHPGPHITLPLEKAKETVVALVEALDPAMVMSVFRCATFASADDFLTALATKQGKFAKGGTPNTVSAARTLIRQWNEGHIPHYTAPPQPDEGEGEEEGEGGLSGMFRVANEAMVAELRVREGSGGDEKRYIVLEESLFAEEEGEGEKDEDDEDEEMEEEGVAEEDDEGETEEQGEEEAKRPDTTADDEQEDVDMDDQEELETKQAVDDAEEEVIVNPSPVRTRSSRRQRSPALSINTKSLASKQQPLLTPSRTQQTSERRRREEERKEPEAQEAVEVEDEEVLSEPDSPAKNTRSHRKKPAASSAPPIAAVTAPRRSARAKSSVAEQQTMADTTSSASTTRTRARRK